MSYSQTYRQFANQTANIYGVPPALLQWQMGQESSWNPSAVNQTPAANGEYATGIAGFLPSTAANPGYGVAPFSPTDPYASINGAAQYDAALYQQTGSWSGALTQYGTLANVPQSVTDSFNQMLAQNGIPNSGTTPAGTTPAGTTPAAGAPTFWQDPLGHIANAGYSFVGELALRISLLLVGLVMLAGGFFLVGRTGGLGLSQFNPFPRQALAASGRRLK